MELKKGDEIPTGLTIEVVLDRMQRASNFASNGVYLATNGDDPVSIASTYISATRTMLDEAQRALDAIDPSIVVEQAS
jgi:hypothetical protein